MFDWAEYLELADELSERGDEKSQRSAISRAYYAVFCSCRNWLYQQGRDERPSTSASVHREVARGFLQSNNRYQRRVGQLLHKLRTYRNRADYEDTLPEVAELANETLEEAHAIFLLLNLLRSPPDPAPDKPDTSST